MQHHRWVLQTSLPNAFQHIAVRPESGTTASVSLCGKLARMGVWNKRWYDNRREPVPGRRLCPVCTRMATEEVR